MTNENFPALLEQEKETILKLLPVNDKAAQDRWWALGEAIAKSASLQRCAKENPMSIISAMKKLADWGLVPDGEEAFLAAYNTDIGGQKMLVAEAQPMYKGMIKRAKESGVIRHCVADVIRTGDTISEEIGPEGRVLRHTRQFGAPASRNLIGAYAIFWLPGGLIDFELFEADDIAKCREAAKNNAERRGGKLGPAYMTQPGEMAKKSVIKRGLKRMRGKAEGVTDDAERRFSEMVANDTHFDIDVTETAEMPDNPPKGKPKEGDGVVLTQEVVHDEPEDRLLTDDEAGMLFSRARALKIKTGAYAAMLFEKFNVEDFAELKRSQLDDCGAALEEMKAA